MIDCSKTENYFAEKARMTKKDKLGRCKLYCGECLLNNKNNGTSENLLCGAFEAIYPEKAIEIVQRWSDEHPPKTFLTEFLKNYPNAQLRIDGTPRGVCPYYLGLMSRDDCRKDHNCVKCWTQPIPIEDGEE